MRAQLSVFLEYARKNDREEVAAVYNRALRIVENIFREKENIPLAHLKEDAVFRAIIHEADALLQKMP